MFALRWERKSGWEYETLLIHTNGLWHNGTKQEHRFKFRAYGKKDFKGITMGVKIDGKSYKTIKNAIQEARYK